MAILNSAWWWVRTGGNVLNGGGYDRTFIDAGSSVLTLTDLASTGRTLTSATGGFTSGMVGFIVKITAGTNFKTGYYRIVTFVSSNEVTLDRACSAGSGSSGDCYVGANYADADAAVLSLTDFATSGAGSTTLTSATGGFTSAMVGNCIRIASGTNFQAGYYFVTAYTDANTVTLDRTPTSGGAGTGGTGRLGGAFATPWGNLSNGGSVTAPTIASPLAPGHRVWIRGSGTEDAGVTPDYSMGNNYTSYPAGSGTTGRIVFEGYNGRPLLQGSMLFYSSSFQTIRHFGMMPFTSDTWPAIALAGPGELIDCIIDQNGMDKRGSESVHLIGVVFRNSGSSAAGTQVAIWNTGSNFRWVRILSWRGPGLVSSVGINYLQDSIFANCGGAGADVFGLTEGYRSDFKNCVFYGNTGDGIKVNGNSNPAYEPTSAMAPGLWNCVFVGNGGYAINCPVGTSAAVNEKLRRTWDYNAFYDNASGEINGYETFDDGNAIFLTADPFTDGANGDFSLNSDAGGGALLKGAAFPDF